MMCRIDGNNRRRLIDARRRQLITTAALLPLTGWQHIMADEVPTALQSSRLLLSNFEGKEPVIYEGAAWRGFSDRVMGGRSDAEMELSTIDGKNCARLSGTVTRKSNGGFIQMALAFGDRNAALDGSAYSGIELLLYGNGEDYNVHVRTTDCGWYDESYRKTIFVEPKWQRLRIAWDEFEPNGLSVPLNSSGINRIAVLGWMREFKADVALAEISLYA